MASARDFIGPYRLVRLIRAGSSCQVWEVVKDPDPRRIALKVLLQEHKGNKEEVAQLKNEGAVGIGLDHKNVIKIFEFNNQYNLPFLAMELYLARNLKQEIRERPDFAIFNAPQIIRRSAMGLSYFNEQGYIHCDVKPDNFLVSSKADVKLIDFSIARKSKGGFGSFFGKKTVQGTRSYMSPEQIRGKKLDARSDVYGLGCTIFELLVGKPPYSATSPDELLKKHLTAPPPSMTVFNDRVSPELSNLVIEMLAKNKEDRPKSVRTFLDRFTMTPTFKAGKRPRNPDKDAIEY